MQEVERKRMRPDDGWIRCWKCGHKLFKMIKKRAVKCGEDSEAMTSKIEVKCHSCKELNEIEL